MKNKKIIAALGAVTMLANFSLASLAFATASSEVISGTGTAVILGTPSSGTFTGITASTAAQSSTIAALGAIELKGSDDNYTSLFVQVSATPFIDQLTYGNSFAAFPNLTFQTNASNGALPVEHNSGTSTGLHATDATYTGCNNVDALTVDTPLTDTSGGDGSWTDSTDTKNIVDFTTLGNHSANFDCDFNPYLGLNIPGGTRPGTYNSTVTFTAVPTNP